MQVNQISVAISEDEKAKLSEAFAVILAVLQPKLQGLTKQERRAISKMNDKTLPFCLKISGYCKSNPEFAPLYMEKAEFNKDLDLYQELKPFADMAAQLNSDLSDTTMLAGSEAYDAARFYYHTVKHAASTGNAKAKPIFDDLVKRFPGPKGRKTETPPKEA